MSAGAMVWLCAAYVNPRGEAGPVGLPVSSSLQRGGSTVTPTELRVVASRAVRE